MFKDKYALEHMNDSTWPYWVVERQALPISSTWRHEHFCPIGKPHVVKGIGFRTMPVTEEYYILFNTEVNK